MVKRIERDHGRFRQIVMGGIRKDLRRFMSRGELIGKQGRKMISIPIPEIHIPRFKYNDRETGGVASGEGEVGEVLAPGEEANGTGQAGDAPGAHIMEVEVSLEELVHILEEELHLPRIQPKGKDVLEAESGRYTSIARSGPESLKHFKRTYREALKRQLALGLYDPDHPSILPIREDRRYRAHKFKLVARNAAVVFFMMDVSGSMGDEQKEIVRLLAFWIDLWLRHHYKRLDIRYICHDAAAREVDSHTFYHIKESGGTKISSAYELCFKTIREHYPVDDWNLYAFHFSDGDNWGPEDTHRSLQLLTQNLLPILNLFCYGQVRSAYGSGQFLQDLEEGVKEKADNLSVAELQDKSEVMDAIRTFLGKGK